MQAAACSVQPRLRVFRDETRANRHGRGLESVDPRAAVALVYNSTDHYNAFHRVPGQGKCCGTAGAVAGAAGALGAACRRTRCALHESTPDGYCFYESFAVAFATAGAGLGAVAGGVDARVQGARARAAAAMVGQHVASMGAAAERAVSMAADEEASAEEHFQAWFARHAAEWHPASVEQLHLGRARAERAAAAAERARESEMAEADADEADYMYLSGSDSG